MGDLRRALVHAPDGLWRAFSEYDWSGNTAVPRGAEFANAPWWTAEAPAIAVRLFCALADHFHETAPVAYAAWLAPLRGKNLACWCHLCPIHAGHPGGRPLGEHCDDCDPCHVDVLIDLANPPTQAEAASADEGPFSTRRRALRMVPADG